MNFAQQALWIDDGLTKFFAKPDLLIFRVFLAQVWKYLRIVYFKHCSATVALVLIDSGFSWPLLKKLCAFSPKQALSLSRSIPPKTTSLVWRHHLKNIHLNRLFASIETAHQLPATWLTPLPVDPPETQLIKRLASSDFYQIDLLTWNLFTATAAGPSFSGLLFEQALSKHDNTRSHSCPAEL